MPDEQGVLNQQLSRDVIFYEVRGREVLRGRLSRVPGTEVPGLIRQGPARRAAPSTPRRIPQLRQGITIV